MFFCDKNKQFWKPFVTLVVVYVHNMFKKRWVLNDINKYCCKCICTPSLTTRAHFTLSREIICLTCTARLKLHDDEQRLSKKKKNITKSSQPNGYAATEWIMDLCSCILQILRNFQPPLGFFLITSIFSCLSGVVVGVLIQSNERRDNDPPFFLLPRRRPAPLGNHWRWPASFVWRPMLISRKDGIMIFLVVTRWWVAIVSSLLVAKKRTSGFCWFFHGYLPLSENEW